MSPEPDVIGPHYPGAAIRVAVSANRVLDGPIKSPSRFPPLRHEISPWGVAR